MLRFKILLAGMLLLSFTPMVHALPYYGMPVTGIGLNEPAVPNCPSHEGDSCFNPSNGEIFYYIPLSEPYSGVFGVNYVPIGPNPEGTAGTISDVGSGIENALTMYLKFEPINLLASNAKMEVYSIDLDLKGGNDPYGFFETIQFFNSDGIALTNLIEDINQVPSDDILPYNISGNSYSQTISFPDLSPLNGGTYLSNPFYLELNLGSKYKYNGRNTIESLSAKIVAVPEPSTFLLMGLGFSMLLFLKKGFRLTPISSQNIGRKPPLS